MHTTTGALAARVEETLGTKASTTTSPALGTFAAEPGASSRARFVGFAHFAMLNLGAMVLCLRLVGAVGE